MSVINGTSASDTLYGGNTSDIIRGFAGDDTLFGAELGSNAPDTDNDSIYGGDGSDTLWGLSGDDHLSGGTGSDYLLGGRGNDYLSGGGGDDSLLGQEGNDRIYGREGDDGLIGYTGNDTLVGGDGNDTLNGAGVYQDGYGPQDFGAGSIDTLTGGAGEDSFILWGGSGRGGTNVYYTANAVNDYALITDFNLNDDTIYLTKKVGFGADIQDVNYSLGASPDGLPQGTGLYINESGGQQELIAILQNMSPDSLNLNSDYFYYS